METVARRQQYWMGIVPTAATMGGMIRYTFDEDDYDITRYVYVDKMGAASPPQSEQKSSPENI